jgi:hypothetical protein
MKSMNTRTVLSKIVGLVQAILGGFAMFFAFFLFYDIFSLQAAFGFSEASLGFYLWIFIIFGLLSVISGLFLFYEQ